jgi:hypothetical protein
MYYPNNLEPQAKATFRKTVEDILKTAAGPYKDEVNETEFCKLLVNNSSRNINSIG